MNRGVIQIREAGKGEWKIELDCGHSVTHKAKKRPGSARVVWCRTCPPKVIKR